MDIEINVEGYSKIYMLKDIAFNGENILSGRALPSKT